MSLFKKSPSMFYSIFLNNEVCKIYFRELSFQKTVVREAEEKISLKNTTDLSEKISLFLRQTDNKKGFVSVLLTSSNQGLLDDDVNLDDDIVIQEIDDDVIAYCAKTDIEKTQEVVGVNVNEFMNAFKMLYFLYKNQDFKGTSMFVLKFDDNAAVIVANKDKIFFSKMLDFSAQLDELVKAKSVDFAVDDTDEILCQIFKQNIIKIYQDSDEFIENIYIYDEDSLSAEVGYYIFTRIFIKTSVVPINMIDLINKINIKENS
ncbi:hypothetical protein [Campylobacter geochelonis]|uniref:hypothetical protein n=1 Tax=Campylobacter geochelonis TaxID=1780362 RepID=UPI00077079A5|nr:hypothetical protein [Campylobacter geochelonis]CZE47104.1 Uncharacterised protein [Campylobacter geochelonis]CZE51001.1 Uncharacterised protein [Campylobacter geochelonis]